MTTSPHTSFVRKQRGYVLNASIAPARDGSFSSVLEIQDAQTGFVVHARRPMGYSSTPCEAIQGCIEAFEVWLIEHAAKPARSAANP
jgi:hypothetical protein